MAIVAWERGRGRGTGTRDGNQGEARKPTKSERGSSWTRRERPKREGRQINLFDVSVWFPRIDRYGFEEVTRSVFR